MVAVPAALDEELGGVRTTRIGLDKVPVSQTGGTCATAMLPRPEEPLLKISSQPQKSRLQNASASKALMLSSLLS